MKEPLPFLRLIAMAGLCACLLVAGRDSKADNTTFPSLIGTWTGTYMANRYSGMNERNVEIRITEQEGPRFRGVKAWTQDASHSPGTAGGLLVDKAKEAFVGVIGFDGTSLYIAEIGDVGRYDGRLVEPDKMELIYVESGATANVYRGVLTRQP